MSKSGWWWLEHEIYLSIHIILPIVSMYAIYGNIYHQYTPNVSIYTIHGSYGLGLIILIDELIFFRGVGFCHQPNFWRWPAIFLSIRWWDGNWGKWHISYKAYGGVLKWGPSHPIIPEWTALIFISWPNQLPWDRGMSGLWKGENVRTSRSCHRCQPGSLILAATPQRKNVWTPQNCVPARLRDYAMELIDMFGVPCRSLSS